MNTKELHREITEYIDAAKFAVLGYVRRDQTPLLRAMGSFVPDGLDLYFSTGKNAPKVQEIGRNQRISFFFEHDNQELPTWRNVLLLGLAEKVENVTELQHAVKLLSNRSPHFKEQVARGNLPETQIFRLRTDEVEYLDFGRGMGHVHRVVSRPCRLHLLWRCNRQ